MHVQNMTFFHRNVHCAYWTLVLMRQGLQSTICDMSASQQEGPGFKSGSGHFCVEFTCSPCVCVGSHCVLPHPKKHAKWG